VQAGQLLLGSLGFDGKGGYPGASQAGKAGEAAAVLVEQLESYNRGELCR
jgi:hypothetical protein